ncbi:glucosamine-6-phosphate deaminase [Paenibacillus aurantius]|uniref:Glucosamine-6-phosphate deaminase n=1 Tax=Paenibacillus aurantius TaxID=2918900 RepID=A0AA96RFH3_9BACL|nr:glucosamine-6-phosphate deaminase [Paenibacillus aurantius]WNQ11248.1 glucosamine-6-phosphate deaminase [Paenibacillus aurantius]
MKIHVAQTAEGLGREAAGRAEEILNACIGKQGYARIVLSTGASQFTFLQALQEKAIDWSKVEMFHLDEYVGLSESHPASFRKYLKERFLSFAPVSQAHFVNGEGDVQANLKRLGEELTRLPIDLALIGIGENAHIAFNDPPADFQTTVPYKIVDLDQDCKAQQVREGWFPSVDEVPKQAITMTVQQMMKSRVILSCVPNQVKAKAVYETLKGDRVSEHVPATILKTHPDWTLYLDRQSASLLEDSVASK